tara:strand:- start:372 stop:512 length:141 start_codon:yes stop_codon:yes gene_type:complete
MAWVDMIMSEEKIKLKEKKDPFSEIMEELESYDDGCTPQSLSDSGE